MKDISLSKLTLKNLEYYAYHGVKSEEKKLGGKYQVDLDLWYNSTTAVVNDDVNYALNYEEAVFCVSEIINNDSYNLIETVANEILNSVMEKFSTLLRARVKVRKFYVPMRRTADYIQVEQEIKKK